MWPEGPSHAIHYERTKAKDMDSSDDLPSIKIPILGDLHEPDMQNMRQLCDTLGLLEPPSTAPRHAWHVDHQPISHLHAFPNKLQHAGRYEWAGEPDERPPKWLWDSQEYCTVEATADRLMEGYIAVSYTWGRWLCGTTRVAGTDWAVPVLKDECRFNLKTLRDLLHRMPGSRYFWIDVLCIHQEDVEEKREEIAKQGAIFAQAKATITYLWTIENGDSLAQAICNLGDFVLRSIEISLERDRTKSAYVSGELKDYQYHAKVLQRDWWFTSLWTLQEMILFPSSVWMAIDGSVCVVNGKMVTTAFVASAISLVEQMVYTIVRSENLRLLERIRRPFYGVSYRFLVQPPLDAAVESSIKAIREQEPVWTTVFRGWRTVIGEHSAIKCALTASRPALLQAASKREATERRGEAVLAAMKIAGLESLTGEDNLAPGGLPVALVNEILRLEGRLVFNASHAPQYEKYGDRFFSDIIPMTAVFVTDTVTALGIESLPADGWQIDVEGNLYINPRPAFQSLEASENSVEIILHFKRLPEHNLPCRATVIERDARDFVHLQYRLWRELYDTLPGNTSQFPDEVDVQFLPIGVRTGNVATLGVIIARGRRDGSADWSRKWYKCGMYVSRSFDTEESNEDGEIVVGKILGDTFAWH